MVRDPELLATMEMAEEIQNTNLTFGVHAVAQNEGAQAPGCHLSGKAPADGAIVPTGSRHDSAEYSMHPQINALRVVFFVNHNLG